MKIRQASRVQTKSKRRGRAKRGNSVKNLLRLIWRVAVVCVVLGFFTGAGYGGWRLLSTSEYLSLKKIEITGISRLKAKEIERSMGVNRGVNLLVLDLDLLEKRILANPWVKGVSVKREWPDTLNVHLKEHVPVAVADIGDRYLIDKDGNLFAKVKKEEKWDLPVITGLPSSTKVKKKLPPQAMKVVKLLRLSSKRPSTLGIGNIKEIKIVDGKGFLVYIDSMELRFGPDDLERQYARAEKVLYHIYRSGLKGKIAKVDLAYGDNMAWAKLSPGKAVQ